MVTSVFLLHTYPTIIHVYGGRWRKNKLLDIGWLAADVLTLRQELTK